MAFRGPLGVFANTPDALSNPFAAALGGASGGGGGGFGGLLGLGAGGAPTASAGQPSRRYNPMGDPNGALARSGWIGSLLSGSIGGPTREEFAMEQAGMAQQQAFQKISQSIEAGMAPQKAILDFVNSPEGSAFFTSGSGMTDLANFVKGVTPPAPESTVLAQGSTIGQTDPSTGVFTPQYTAPVAAPPPTTDMQNFQALSEIGRLTPDEQASMARAMMLKNINGDMSAAQEAVGRLVKGGVMSQEVGDLLLSGALEVTPILDAAGGTQGHAVINKTKGSIFQLPSGQDPAQAPKPGSPDYAEGITPGTKPEELVGQTNNQMFQQIANPADIVDSAGPGGWLSEKLGAFGGMVAPSVVGESARNRKALAIIQADAQQLARSGKMLAGELKLLDGITNNLGIMTNPRYATEALIMLHDMYDNREAVALEEFNNPGSTNKVRGDAQIELGSLRRAKANLPSREGLTAKLSQIEKQYPGQALTEMLIGGEEAAETMLGGQGKPEQGPPADAASQPPESFGKGKPEHIRQRAWQIFQQGKAK